METLARPPLLPVEALRRAGRTWHERFRVSLLAGGSAGEFQSEAILRHIPGTRMVCRGDWCGKAVVAKLLLHRRGARRRAEREARGLAALASAGVPVPQLVGQGVFADDRRLPVLLLEELQDAQSLKEALAAAESDSDREALLRKLVILIARQHDAGLEQIDLHLDNFLVRGETLYAIDGGLVRIAPRRQPITQLFGLNNLALAVAQLPMWSDRLVPDLYGLYTQSRRSTWQRDSLEFLHELVNKYRQRRIALILKKSTRECSDFFRVREGRLKGVCSRRFDSPEMRAFLRDPDAAIAQGTLLKNGGANTVALVQVNGVDLVVKRYNLPTWQRRLRYLFRPTQALRSWHNAHRLEALGIPHASPVAYAERSIGPWKQAAYQVCTRVRGPVVKTFISAANSAETSWQPVAAKIIDLVDTLGRACLSHGDFKATNLIVDGDILRLIDLDGMRQHAGRNELAKAHGKDLLRILQNFNAASPFYRFLAQAVADRLGGSQGLDRYFSAGRLQLWYRIDSPVPLTGQTIVNLLQTSPQPADPRVEFLKRDIRRLVFRVTAGDRSIIVKSFPLDDVKSRLRWKRYAPAEYSNQIRARACGMPIPECYGLFRIRGKSLVENCGVVIEDLKDYVSLADRASSNQAELLKGVPFLVSMYRAGVYHMDPSPFNLLLHRTTQQPKILDWQYASFTHGGNDMQLVLQAGHFLRFAEVEPGESLWTHWVDTLHEASGTDMPLSEFRAAVRSSQSRNLRPSRRAKHVARWRAA